MIKFFRRLRLKLLEGGNMKKYLLYAIGEILLVVFGILIALQINNWNTNTQEVQGLIRSLDQMHESLNLDLEYLKARINVHVIAAKGADESIKHLIRKDSLTNEFYRNISKAQYNTIFRLKSSTFESLKLNGLKLIDNGTLKQQLFKVYEEEPELIKQREAIIERTRANYYDRWMARNIIPDTSNYEDKIKDYNSVLEDSEFLGNLNLLRGDHLSFIRDANYFALEIQNLQAQITIALDQLKKGKAVSFLKGKQSILFILEGYEQAEKVGLSGPIVGWQDQDHQLKKVSGQWQIEIGMPPGHYFYNYFIDGESQHDPENPNKLPNGADGDYFSVKYVPY